MLIHLVTLAGWLTLSIAGSPIWPEPNAYESHGDVLWIPFPLRTAFSCGLSNASNNDFFYERSRGSLSHLLGGWQSWFGFASDVDEDQLGASVSEADAVKAAVGRTLQDISTSKFIPWKFHSRHDAFEPAENQNASMLTSLYIYQSTCPSSSFDAAAFFDGDESYEIDVTEGVARINAVSSIGIINALGTFKQLVLSHSSGVHKTYMTRSSIKIKDNPRWRYRGISLDIARNPFKSWPIDIPSLPELALKGAYRPDLVWSTEDIARIQQYGISRNVQVFLELDMPGHTASIAHAYPDLIAAFNQLDWDTFAAEPLSGQFKLNSTKVHDFLDTLFEDLLPRLSKYSSIYHLGGDEVNRMVHLLDETVQSANFDTLQPLIQSLMQRIYTKAIENNLRPIIWEEMFLEWNLTLVNPHPSHHHIKPLVQAWRSSANIASLLKANHSVIFGDSEHWYLDCGHGVFLSPYPSGHSPPGIPYNTSGGLPTKLSPPYLDYCGPYHNWRAIYTFNPLANISEELWGGIEGGETLMWSELTDSVDLDAKLWPRAAAAAEVLWRGPRSESMLAAPRGGWRCGENER
ncbi:Beta-hexosaminidase 2 [Cyphellophora attinorum]|uniref:Beta-hexosaminidase n=1 Tax=Cyphellophora attinorum TaxID=1664694 RepID=A0A0N1NYY9_9EURO|nr:Beta-hexosaminidase 2 [Phialophora attinorum]KPI40007.1 Beta-hexosaminidase 2 [Phialophora attinorum]